MSDDSLPPRLPRHELGSFLVTITQAIGLARVGEVLSGYRCLLGGLERAEEAAEAGEPWGAELVARYRLALERYGEKWGIRLE